MLAVEEVSVRVWGEVGSVLEVSDGLRASFAAGVSEDLALQDQLDPSVAVVPGVVDGGCFTQSLFDEPVVRAEDVRDDGVRFGEIDDDAECFADGQSCSADLLGQPQGTESGASEGVDLLVWILVGEVAGARAFGDGGEQFSVSGRARLDDPDGLDCGCHAKSPFDRVQSDRSNFQYRGLGVTSCDHGEPES